MPMRNDDLSARRGSTLYIWTPEDKAFWEREGEAIAKINPLDFRAGAFPGLCHLASLERGGGQPARTRPASPTQPTSCSG